RPAAGRGPARPRARAAPHGGRRTARRASVPAWIRQRRVTVTTDWKTMIQLYYHPGNASMAPHMLLEELGVPFELLLVDRAKAAHKSAEYLKLNPNGQIPVLVDSDLVLYETAAIG